ncbi:hypothetical protein [Bradyrhizobium sp. Tv2a-2]|uniref:hypothetical protein n=1 Tax=Bradyrhizobium sp. Tv2a-2 TaxID=113395 RepID=UPI000411770D|nr:hypothetical protein [Bradyrhizobium sp. Tv2a-2]
MTSLRGDERTEFPQSVRKAAFRRCCLGCRVKGVENIPGVPQCEGCGTELRPGNIFYEHMDPDGLGGDPTAENCQVRCRNCKKTKDKVDNAIMTKADNVLKASYGLKRKTKKIQSKGFEKAPGQRRASTPVEKWKGF